MKLDEIKATLIEGLRESNPDARYDVIVASPKRGGHKEAVNLPYDEARQVLIRTFEEYRTPMFRDEPQNIEWKWIGKDEAGLTNNRTGLVIFFYLRDVSNKR